MHQINTIPCRSFHQWIWKDRIITTGLINRNFPLIRYSVEDRITVKGNDFLNNLVSPEIISIDGRAGDTVELRDGSIVGCLDHAFKGVNHLECAQIHQYDDETTWSQTGGNLFVRTWRWKTTDSKPGEDAWRKYAHFIYLLQAWWSDFFCKPEI